MDRTTIGNGDGSTVPFFMEHRWGNRQPCQAHVRLSAGEDISGPGRVRDISSSGAFIETALVLPECTPVTVFVLGNESAARVVEVEAIVVRTDPQGVGVEWCETSTGSICSRVGCTVRCAARSQP